MQSRRKKIWQYLRKETNGPTAKLDPQSQTECQSAKLYRSCHELPLRKFIDIFCGEPTPEDATQTEAPIGPNLAGLIISGFPPQEQLEKAWRNIMQEYMDAIGSEEYKIYISIHKELTELAVTYDSINGLIDLLEIIHSRELCIELNRLLASNFKFNPEDETQYFDDLKRCRNKSKIFKLRLDLKELEFNEIEKRFKTGAKPQRGFFITMLIRLSDKAQYQIQDTITVHEYCQRIQDYNAYLEQFKKQHHVR